MPKKSQPSESNTTEPEVQENQPKEKQKCGIVMPISDCDGCSESHWKDVLDILKSAVESTEFEASLVSESDDVGIIQERIIHNLYDNQIVVCDVSGKNANVMFELGLRLAFDKPTIIVKDDKTSYSFDTSPIEHLGYPRDLRHKQIEKFKVDLADKITSTVKAAKDPNYTTFLKHFGKFKVAHIESETVGVDEFVVRELKNLSTQINRIEKRTSYNLHDKAAMSLAKDLESIIFAEMSAAIGAHEYDTLAELYSKKTIIKSHVRAGLDAEFNLDWDSAKDDMFDRLFNEFIDDRRWHRKSSKN